MGIVTDRVIRVKVPEQVKIQATGWLSNNQMGQRRVNNGSPAKQLTGLLAEASVEFVTMGAWPDYSAKPDSQGFDGGWDIVLGGMRLDVKCLVSTGWVKDSYSASMFSMQANYDNDGYVFCSYNKYKLTYEVVGWIDKSAFLQKARIDKAGTPMLNGVKNYRYDSHVLPYSELYDIRELIKKQ